MEPVAHTPAPEAAVLAVAPVHPALEKPEWAAAENAKALGKSTGTAMGAAALTAAPPQVTVTPDRKGRHGPIAVRHGWELADRFVHYGWWRFAAGVVATTSPKIEPRLVRNAGQGSLAVRSGRSAVAVVNAKIKFPKIAE